ncbi:hypothetical protein INT47_003035 [Mucor saturninus]|uniref:EF-hand domain-containing protein n=1 Tax=Mucor saturninus TaxID=64648 RepID=A0A8H7UY22_9FUNG|nr:hypothetical protein INT47_003035 [Mucor saturninus]
MGQTKSRESQENNLLSKKTHFSKKEIHDLRHKVDSKSNITPKVFKESCTFSKDDRTTEIKEMVEHMFKDFDVDNDGRLSFEEYKLSAMKEPLIVDFLEQFLAEHRISAYPRAPSRAASIRSHISTRSPSSSRLSVRLSQAELLDYSHQHERKGLSRPTSMTSLDAALTSMEVGATLSNITK